MPHFKDLTGRLYFLSPDDIDAGGFALLPAGSEQITDAEADAIRAAMQPTEPAVPQIVTRRQAMLALLAADKLDAVNLAIQNAPRAVQITWETARDFERTNPLIEALAPQLGLTEADVDALFIEASKL